jgi:hypothetical protein
MTAASTNSLANPARLMADLGDLWLESLIRRFRTSIRSIQQSIHFPKMPVLPHSAPCSARESTHWVPPRNPRRDSIPISSQIRGPAQFNDFYR